MIDFLLISGTAIFFGLSYVLIIFYEWLQKKSGM